MGWMDEAIPLDEPTATRQSWMDEAIPLDEPPRKGLSKSQRREIGSAANDEMLLAQAHKVLGESNLPSFKAGMIQTGAGFVSPAARVLGYGDYADQMNRFSSAVERAQQEKEAGGVMPDFIQRGARGIGTSLATAIPAGAVAGPYGAIAAFSGQEGNRAITEGKDAGLEGVDLAGHVARQATIEAAPALVMQRLGMGGLESVVGGKQAVASGLKQGFKQAGKTVAQELPEELITEIGHSVESVFSGVDEEALSKESIKQTVADTVFQTVGAVGLAEAPNIAASHKRAKVDAEIVKTADEGRVPTRKQWKSWGLPEEAGRSRKDRKEAVRQVAEVIKSNQSAATQAAAPTLQAEQATSPQATAEASLPVQPDAQTEAQSPPPPLASESSLEVRPEKSARVIAKEARDRGELTEGVLNREVEKYWGTAGISSNNRDAGFKPAFRHAKTGDIFPAKDSSGNDSGVHLLGGIPGEYVTERDPEYGDVIAVSGDIESGFVRDGKFFTREEAANYQPEATVATPAVDADTSTQESPHPGDMESSDFVVSSEYDKERLGDYFDEEGTKLASSRGVPASKGNYTVGSWKIDDTINGMYGHFIEQLREVDPNEIVLPEGDYHADAKLNPEGRGDDARRYAEWMKQGLTPPPVSIIEMDNGELKVSDGHRRAAAAKAAGKPLLAWVSPRADTGKKDVNGDPIYTGLTYELAKLQRGKLQSDVLAKYPEMQEAAKLSGRPPSPGDTSIQNAVVTQQRAKRDEEPVAKAEPETFEDWLDTAQRKIASEPSLPGRLIEEVSKKPRTLSDEETAVLQVHYRGLTNEFNAASDALFAAQESGDAAAIERAKADSNAILKDLQAAEVAATKAGTEAGRSLVARKMMIQPDYSLGGTIRRMRVAKGGQELTASETDEAKKLSEEVVRLEAEVAALKESKQAQDADAAIDRLIANAKPRKRLKLESAERKAAARANVNAALADFKARLGKSGGVSEFLSEEKGSLDVDLVASGVNLAKAYVDLGVTSFAEFFVNVKLQLEGAADTAKDSLRQAWSAAQDAGLVAKPEIDAEDARAMSRYAQRIARAVVSAGVTEREAVVDAVHEELQAISPDITRRSTMDAISGYGQYSELSKDEVSVALRDVKGQLQQLAKLEDMQAGRAPKKTGVERREPSDEERHLIQQVNEAKRKGGFEVTDPERQLKTALAAMKTAARNRIADLEEEIKTRERIVRQRSTVEPDAELIALRAQRDKLREEHAKVFPREPLSEAQQIKAALAGLDRSINQITEDLKSGNIGPKKKPTRITSPEIEAKRAELEHYRAMRAELRLLANPKPDPEAAKTAAYKRMLTKKLADLERRMRESDFSKQEVKKTVLDEEAMDLKYRAKVAKERLSAMEERFRKSQLTGAAKVMHLAGEASNLARAMKTSIDLSALLRQGKFAVAANPKLAPKTVDTMLKAFWSPEAAFKMTEELRTRKYARLGDEAGLERTSIDGKLTEQEEAFRGELSKHVPLVAGSERAYVAGLNHLRAAFFDQLVDSVQAGGRLRKGGEITINEAKAIANMVNVFTGRGSYAGQYSSAAQLLSTYIFSPRFVASRFQLLLGQPLWHGSARTRMLVAEQYGRSAMSLSAYYILAAIGGMFALRDEDKPIFEWNPLSTEFGKIRFGETVIDPLAGLAQVTTFSFRMISGKTKMSTGEVVPIRGEGVPFKGSDVSDVFTRMVRTKLAPIPGAVWNAAAGEDVVGNPTSVGKELLELPIPLSFGDIYDATQTDGYSNKAILSALAVFGDGVKRYENATPARFADKISEHPKLRGINKQTGKRFDYTDVVRQVAKEAKKRHMSENDLIDALVKKAKEEGRKPETIMDMKRRLRSRY